MQGTTNDTPELGPQSTPADALTATALTGPGILAQLIGFNGAAYDRIRVANSGATSTGKLAVSGGTGAFTSLNAATANANGAAISFGTAHTRLVGVVTVTGAPATYTVTMQVSIDNTNWEPLATTFTQADANGKTKFMTDSGLCFIQARAVLSALTGGTAPTVTCALAAA